MILMLTAAGAPDERVTGLTLGADDYLPKPFHFPELVCACGLSPDAGRQPTAARCEQPESSSTRQQERSLETDARSH
jgi:DNA-binding response OmpR family regulator